jgi:heat shock protein HslJ
MACPLAEMDMESRYLQALQNVERFSFLAGDLILTWQDKTGVHAMRFAGLQSEANQKS